MDFIDQLTNIGDKTKENLKRAIPILIYWAQTGSFEHSYGDLIQLLGYSHYSGIGTLLGNIHEVMTELSQTYHIVIPTLNSLVKNRKTHLPSAGFSFVYPDYESLSDEKKRDIVKDFDRIACEYSQWGKILSLLGLKPYNAFSDSEINDIQSCGIHFASGGEGEGHLKLKKFVLNNPDKVGIFSVEIMTSTTEYPLPSGDKIDVFFELKDGSKIAVEVKPEYSPDDDISRGIFQCVKYRSVLDAVRRIEWKDYDVRVLLVTTRNINELNKRLAETLSIKFIDNFQI